MSKSRFTLIVVLVLILLMGALSTGTLAEEKKVPAPQSPVVVTTCGQSPGALMFKLLCDRAKIPCVQVDLLTAKDLKDKAATGEGYKTLVITMGTSMKGMGAAGTDINADIARIKALIEEARKQGMTLIGAHIEGMARRVDSMDALSIETVAPVSDLIMVTESSDEDGFFTKLAQEKKIQLIKVKETLNLVEALKTLFNKQ